MSMQTFSKTWVTLPALQLVGISTRTNNAENFEGSPSKRTIATTIQKYFGESVPNQLPNRNHPGTTYGVYTEYESDWKGDYTYFIGETVSGLLEVKDSLKTLTIPQQSYVKFTSPCGPMPAVCVGLWEAIWKMTPEDLGGKRAYTADFEVYDTRPADPSATVLDIYISIQPCS